MERNFRFQWQLKNPQSLQQQVQQLNLLVKTVDFSHFQQGKMFNKRQIMTG